MQSDSWIIHTASILLLLVSAITILCANSGTTNSLYASSGTAECVFFFFITLSYRKLNLNFEATSCHSSPSAQIEPFSWAAMTLPPFSCVLLHRAQCSRSSLQQTKLNFINFIPVLSVAWGHNRLRSTPNWMNFAFNLFEGLNYSLTFRIWTSETHVNR